MYRILFLLGLSFCVATVEDAQAQTANAVQRRAERNQRQLNRLDRRLDFANDQGWRALDPWIKTYNPGVITTRPATTTTTTGTTANTATSSTYGFTGPSTSWIYDYYTYYPRSYNYSLPNNSTYTYRYYDRNHDGVYDGFDIPSASSTAADSDLFNRYDFSEAKDDTQITFDKEVQVTGTVVQTKTVKVNGQPTLVAQLAGADRSEIVVDLGTKLDESMVAKGAKLSAEGYMQKVGDKNVLFAENVQIENKVVEVERGAPSIEGVVLEVQTIPIQGQEHVMAIVDTPHGKQLVDLGLPSKENAGQITKNQKITVYGVPVMARDRQIIIAQRLVSGPRDIVIQR